MKLGIIGGMGPNATIQFLQHLTRLTPIEKEQDHIPYVLISIPEIPDRSYSLLNGHNTDQLKIRMALLESAKNLEEMSVTHIVMICNTAHYWEKAIRNSISIPFLSIIKETCDYIHRQKHDNICILSTEATKKTQLYETYLNAYNVNYSYPNKVQQQHLVKAIYCIKEKEYKKADIILKKLLFNLNKCGCSYFILGCTELPILLKGEKFIDPSIITIRKILSIN